MSDLKLWWKSIILIFTSYKNKSYLTTTGTMLYILPLRSLQNSSDEVGATMFKFTPSHFIQALWSFSVDQCNYLSDCSRLF